MLLQILWNLKIWNAKVLNASIDINHKFQNTIACQSFMLKYTFVFKSLNAAYVSNILQL